jgi:uncharacterized protein YodC (DUF2158 family)
VAVTNFTNKLTRFTLKSGLDFGDKVHADDGDVLMTVTGFMFTTVGCQVECSWFANGSHNQVWFYEWRLAKKEV